MALTTITNSMVSVNAIQGTLIADNAITAVHIATNAVSGTLIADNAITAVHIAQNVITVTQLADDAVEADKIADGIITTNHLNKAMISSQTEVSAVAGDYVLLGDTSDSNNLKKALVSDFGNDLDAAVTINDSGADVDFRIESDDEPNAFVVNGGDDTVLIGTAVSDGTVGITPRFQIEGTSKATGTMSITRNSNDVYGPHLVLAKTRGTTVNSDTVIQDDDYLGVIAFAGADGTDRNSQGAAIHALVDGTPGGDDLPGRMVFLTTADGASGPTDRMTILSGGNVLIGHGSATPIRTLEQRVQISGTDQATSGLSLARYQNGAYAPGIHFAKSRNATVGSHTIVQDGDRLGDLNFYGSDGTDFTGHAATIMCEVDGTPGDNDTPGRLTFHTTADGAASATERVRIDSAGKVGIGTSSPSADLHLYHTDGDRPHVLLENYGNRGTGDAPILEFYLNDQTTGGIADNTQVGVITFAGDEKDGGTKETYGQIRGIANDPGSGSSNKGTIDFMIQKDGTLTQTMALVNGKVGIGTGVPATELHVNGAITSNDLFLTNEGKDPNMFDGTNGSWQIQEGSDDLFIMNKLTGKKYKFKLEEI